jgi:acyl carrier protein
MADNATLDVEQLRSLIADTLELEPADVTDEAAFVDELQVDSLALLDIATRLEQAYGIEVEDSELKGVGTFADVRALVEAKLGNRAAA